MKHLRTLLLALVLAAVGCASAGGGDGAQRPGRQANFLSQDEIQGTNRTNLYDVVATLRPGWLRTRGQISIGDPEAGQVVVYLGEMVAGGAEYLRQVGPREVSSLEYLDEIQAGARFGLKQDGGPAIVIHMNPGS